MKKELREQIQYYGTFLTKFISKCFSVFPIHDNRIIFTSSAGKQYECSPRYISEYLETNFPNQFEIVWAVRDSRIVSNKRFKAVRFLAPLHFYYFSTSKVIVDNVGFPTYMSKRKDQYVINTWHGGGAYKRCDVSAAKSSSYRIKMDKAKCKNTDLALSSSEVFSKKVIPDIIYKYSGDVLNCGMPRNDIFFNNIANRVKEKTYRNLNINLKSIVVLYAPTYRGYIDVLNGSTSQSKLSILLDIERLCHTVERRYHKKAEVVLRAHHALIIDSAVGKYIDATTYPDMQELLCAADILISDYSSTIWDFSLTKKPCFLYCPDLDYYLNEDRGVYTPIETWPGILCRTNEELEQAILNFDEAEYVKKVEKHHADLGSYETGHACEQVCKRIAEVCGIEEQS